ncbi:gliding motility-associated C-terminal domain-containing protein [Sediminibacterium roseum]|uniref:Gliding motility-associated C-terminal domain-containing protein n=1 Tax=Sediminibacterium roseum TaxID=1978412 RepID=A0ABW9ZT66_9BACT|nr:gliding motility-associated C-terminal domain-containing protein [Sediminibacterium roseum]NCI48290.1 gliding motility-associated C-terminal domain-containing protein [Sediminibacterium roseum]
MIRKRISYKNLLLRASLVLQACCVLGGRMHAQSTTTFGVTVFSNAGVYAHDKAQVGIMSDVTNNGIFGSVPGSVVNMGGAKWTNGNGSSLPDELGIASFSGVGGVFRFISNNRPQSVVPNFTLAGRTGVSFPNLAINNPFGLTLESDAHIRNNLHFENGIIWINGNNLLVGTTGPGTITGYSDKRFVGTGNTTRGGFLYRSKVSGASGNVVFPIGPQAGSYSPLSIMYNATTPQDIHVRAFDDVYSAAFIGTKGSPLNVQQTWMIGQEDTVSVASILALQHMEAREGAAFTAHRGDSYVSMYDFVKRAWDTLPPSGVGPGSITSTFPPLGNAFVNTRALNAIGLTTYLTKSTHLAADSLVIGKGALQPVRQPDGSFVVTFQFFVRNEGLYRADSLEVLDSLDKVFKTSMSFSVSSVAATGNLKPNSGFDGVTSTNLLLKTSTIAPNVTDTITLVLNVRTSGKEEYYYNTAVVQGVLNGFNNSQYLFKNHSVNGFAPPLPGARPVPTPVVLTEAKYVMPQGFSPNGDGVNDYFIIGNLGNAKASLFIFDKNGVYVYKNNNYKNDWDGTNNQNVGGGLSNQKIADGTYFYKAVITDTATGKQETYNGFISVWK